MTAGDHGLVSVILPFHNRGDSLSRAIESVLTQSYEDLEVILVDDASSDDSHAVAAACADPRTSVVTLDRRIGPSGARNAGLDRARGRYVAFQDSDDRWFAHKLATQLNALAEAASEPARDGRTVGMIGCRASTTADHTELPPPTHPARASFVDVLADCVRGIGTPMLVFDRTVVGTPKFDADLPALVDRDFVLAALGHDHDVVVLSEELIEISRGRGDHVATPERALVAFELLIAKYAAELATMPRVLAWYHFRAMREALRADKPAAATRHAHEAREVGRLRVAGTRLAGRIAGERGLAVAARLGGQRNPCCDGNAARPTSGPHG